MTYDLGIIIYPEDKTEVFPVPEWGMGSKITIERALPVMVNDANQKKVYHTWAKKVDEFLKEKNIELLGQDSIEPSLDTFLRQDMTLTITRVAEVEVTEKAPIDYKVVKRTDVDLEKGQTKIEKKGVKGEKEIVYIIRRVNGVEVAKTQKSSQIVREPENEIVIVGIGPKLAQSGPYKDTINDAARRYLINGTALMCLMLAESGGSADAGYPDADYKGLFQYTDGFWTDISARAGYGGSSIYNGPAQIYTTAYALTHGYGGRWPPWSRCSNR